MPENSAIMIKRGFVLHDTKGMGSAYGAQWKPDPNKPNDMAFIGPPNTIQRIFIPNRKGGYWIQVKYADDGWAVAFRHETTHHPNQQHTDPHDHYSPDTNVFYDTPDELLEHRVGKDRLRDVITKVTVIDRTL